MNQHQSAFYSNLRSAVNAGLETAESQSLHPQTVLNELMRSVAALSVVSAGPMATAEALRDLADQIDREFSRLQN